MSAAPDPRIDAILEVLLAFARQDFTKKAPIGEAHDAVDAIAAGLNMLAEELHGEVASRKELESAYRSMKEAQARLVHGGKLVAIGQLASGVAHEINNPASWLLGSITMLERELAATRAAALDPSLSAAEVRTRSLALIDGFGAWLRDATDGVERIVAVTRDLRTFSRADSDEVEILRVADLARAACNLARPLLQREAHVELLLDDSATVRGSRGKLGQVLTNLLVNATQAAAASTAHDRQIRIEVARRESRVILTVDDSGAGIPPELRQRVFEPFYTTKDQEEGTGLGLSLVAEIVRSHEGTVVVLDSPLGGARFQVTLPFVDVLRREVAPAPEATVLSRRPRILIVDDEPRLLQTFVLMLRASADVIPATNGREALRLLESDRSFDVILCDLQMPELDGPGFYEQVRVLVPELCDRILFTSGGVFRRSVREFLARTSVAVLEKPVREEVLLAAVKRLMA